MDQIVLDVGDDECSPVTSPRCRARATDGGPTARRLGRVVGTINYEIVTRFGAARVPRVYDGTAGVPA
jgi:alanine racemase